MSDRLDGRAAFNCTGKDCQHWNTRKCLSCEAYLTFQIINKPAPNICRYPTEFIEEFTPDNPRLASVYDCLAKMPLHHATLILQRHILKMSTREMATFHRISRSRVSRQISQANDILNHLIRAVQAGHL